MWLFLGPFSLIFAWLSHRISTTAKWVWTGIVGAQLTVVAILLVVVLQGGNSGSAMPANNGAASLQQSIMTSLGPQLQQEERAGYPSAVVSVTDASCIQQSNSNSYDCEATYTISDSSPNDGLTPNPQTDHLNLTGICDSTGCQWHAG